jgi:hypothetical protein
MPNPIQPDQATVQAVPCRVEVPLREFREAVGPDDAATRLVGLLHAAGFRFHATPLAFTLAPPWSSSVSADGCYIIYEQGTADAIERGEPFR